MVPQRLLYLARGEHRVRTPHVALRGLLPCVTTGAPTQLLAALERRWGSFLEESWIKGAPSQGFPDDWPRAH